ncbi:hypothetical protein MBLNU13_g06508t1 [Cladosporium sp. NU13]
MPPATEHSHDDMRPWAATSKKRLTESALQKHTRLSEKQEELLLTRTKTAPNQDFRTVDTPSSKAAGKHDTMRKPSSSPAIIEQSSCELHQDAQGSLSPMERFVKLSVSSDPSPWETKKALRILGFQDVHKRDIGFRLNEAAITAVSGSVKKVGGPLVVAIAESI